MSEKYYFRREDNGEVVEGTYGDCLNMDVMGYITLDDGVQARRCNRPSMHYKGEVPAGASKFEHVSSLTFACIPQAVEDFANDAKRNGFHIDWKPDYKSADADGTINSYNAHIPLNELERYRKHRGVHDRNSKNGSGAMLSPEHFEQAKQLLERQFQRKEAV
jgi:hypothetical protein